MIDSKLSWKKHILELAKKLNRATAILAKVCQNNLNGTLPTSNVNMFQLESSKKITTYVETMERYHCLLDTLAKGGLISYGIKMQSFITI